MPRSAVERVSAAAGPQFQLSWRSVIALIAFVAFVSVLYEGLTDDAIVFEPILVPPDLASRGYVGNVVARRLLDEMRIRKAIVRTRAEDQLFEAGGTKPEEFDVRMAGVSAQEVLRQVQYLLGRTPRTVTGEITANGDRLVAVVRTERGAAETIRGAASAPDALIADMAEAVMRMTQPYWWAAWLRANKSDRAESAARNLVAASSKVDRAWAEVLLGAVLMDQCRIDNATALFKMDQCRIDDATTLFQRALDGDGAAEPFKFLPDPALDRARSQAANNLGIVLARQGQPDQSIARFELAIRLDSDNASAHYNLGVSLLELPGGDPDNARKAQDHFFAATRLEPSASRPLVFLARAQFERGVYGDAMRTSRQAIERDPRNALAYYWLGSSAERLRDDACARMSFARYLSLDPRGPYAGRLEARGMLADVGETSPACFLDR